MQINVKLPHIGALLANSGKDLANNTEIISKNSVKIVLAQMTSCGMYEESGSFLLEVVGISSKSGVSGAILGVVPENVAFVSILLYLINLATVLLEKIY